MSRSTQFIGLNHSAELFLENFSTLPSQSEAEGMFFELIPLGCWRDKNGFIYCEVVQEEIWASGPMIFTCLEKETGKKFCEWTEDDLKAFL